MITPLSASVFESSSDMAALAAPGPESREIPTSSACSLWVSSDCLSHLPKSALRCSGTPPQASRSSSYAPILHAMYGLSGPKNAFIESAARSRASWLSDPQKAWTLFAQ